MDKSGSITVDASVRSKDGVEVRGVVDEAEAASKRGVDQRNRLIGRIHRPNEVEVWRERERLPGVREFDLVRRSFVRFEQSDDFPEDLGEIAAVDFVDDEDKRRR